MKGEGYPNAILRMEGCVNLLINLAKETDKGSVGVPKIWK